MSFVLFAHKGNDMKGKKYFKGMLKARKGRVIYFK